MSLSEIIQIFQSVHKSAFEMSDKEIEDQLWLLAKRGIDPRKSDCHPMDKLFLGALLAEKGRRMKWPNES